MQVVLLEYAKKLGQMGDVVEVKNGYARNFLLPRGKALRATKENLAHFEKRRGKLEMRNLELKKEAEAVAEKIARKTILIIRQAGETGRLYGSVSAGDIAKVSNELGFLINRDQVAMEMPIKALGIYSVTINLHPEVPVAVAVQVAQSEEEAKKQLQKKQEAASKKEDTGDSKGDSKSDSKSDGAALAKKKDPKSPKGHEDSVPSAAAKEAALNLLEEGAQEKFIKTVQEEQQSAAPTETPQVSPPQVAQDTTESPPDSSGAKLDEKAEKPGSQNS